MDFIDSCIERLFEREKGFSNLKEDKGGATKWGITRSTLSFWLKRDASVEDVQNLTRDEARKIYRTLWWEQTRIDQLHASIAEQVFDFAVNSGPHVAIAALQECVGSKPDGKIGTFTIAAVMSDCVSFAGSDALNNDLAKWRTMMLTRIVRRDPTQMKFLSGWVKRALDFITP